MIIDVHCHIFPDAIAERASVNIAKFYDLPVRYDGKVSTLFRLGGEAGVSRYVVHSVATSPTQTGHINDFIAQTALENPGVVTGFAAMHPDHPDMAGEVERALGLGLKGFKIHPDIQQIALDDRRLYKLYELIEGRVPLLAHTGDSRYDYSHPKRMAKVARDFPRLTFICAHLGGWTQWDEAEGELADSGVYVDCSSSLYALSPERARQIIRRFGAERVLFGTDYPMWTPKTELDRLYALGLKPREMEMILHENAERLIDQI